MYTYLFCPEFITKNAKLRLNPFLTQYVVAVKLKTKQKRHKNCIYPSYPITYYCGLVMKNLTGSELSFQIFFFSNLYMTQ